MTARSPRCRRSLLSLLAGVLTLLLCSGCGSSSQLSANSTCKEYLQQSEETRHDAAVRISSEVPGVSDPGNPMWGLSLDAACGEAPTMTIRQYFEHK